MPFPYSFPIQFNGFWLGDVFLDVVRFTERPETIATTVDTAKDNRITTEVKLLGFVRVWELEAVDPPGPWHSSKTKKVKEMYEARQSVNFIVETPNTYLVNTTVNIVGFTMEIGRERVRRIRLTLQEA